LYKVKIKDGVTICPERHRSQRRRAVKQIKSAEATPGLKNLGFFEEVFRF